MRFNWTPEQIRELSAEEIIEIRELINREQKEIKRQQRLAKLKSRMRRR